MPRYEGAFGAALSKEEFLRQTEQQEKLKTKKRYRCAIGFKIAAIPLFLRFSLSAAFSHSLLQFLPRLPQSRP